MVRRTEVLPASQARRLLLAGQALLGDPPPGGLRGLVEQLGYVQMDSINVLERAHHLILGSRSAQYEPAHFEAMLAEERFLFEHWTHDASAIHLQWYPHWKHRFPLSRQKLLANAWWLKRVGDQVEVLVASVLKRVREEGPLRLFGFDYRFEAFVPEAKRRYGYYVLPILEGEALVGRLDPKFHRERGVLEIKGVWWEKGIRPTKARQRRLRDALERLAARLGARDVEVRP